MCLRRLGLPARPRLNGTVRRKGDGGTCTYTNSSAATGSRQFPRPPAAVCPNSPSSLVRIAFGPDDVSANKHKCLRDAGPLHPTMAPLDPRGPLSRTQERRRRRGTAGLSSRRCLVGWLLGGTQVLERGGGATAGERLPVAAAVRHRERRQAGLPSR